MVRDEHLAVLDRTQRAVLDGVLLTVRGGGSRALVVSGAPGTGRSTMLAAAADTARRLGITVAFGRAVPGERHVGLGVAGQLFDALPGALPPDWQPDFWHEPAGVDRLARLCSALSAAARRNPLALLVDDVSWADSASDTLLRMMLRRLHHAPLALIATTSGHWPSSPPGSPEGGSADGDAAPPADDLLMRLGPLTPTEVRDACRRICGRASDPEFTAGALALSAGNPTVLAGALTDYARGGGHPTGEPGTVFAGLVAEHRRGQVVAVLDTLPRGAIEVLRLLAVADGDLDLDVLTSIIGAVGRPADVLAQLRASGLVTQSPQPVRAADAVVRERVLAGMPVPGRRALHSAVAELAHRVAAPDSVVSRILLGAHRPPGGWSVGALRRAAATALDAGRPETAAALVECALGGHLTIDQRADLLLDLAGTIVGDRPEAADRALALVVASPGGDPETSGRRLRAVDLLLGRGAAGVARRAITTRLAALGPTVNPVEQEERDALGILDRLARSMTQPPATETGMPAARPDGPVAAGVAALGFATRGLDRDRSVALATAALAPSFDDQPLATPRLAACSALLQADEFAASEAGLAAVLGEARRRRLRPTAAAALLGLATHALYCGRLDEAAGHLAEADAELPPSAWHPLARPFVEADRVLVDVRRGDLGSAERLMESLRRTGDGGVCDIERGFAWAYYLYARGVHALEAGDPTSAAHDLRECGRRLAARRWRNPLLIRWRPMLARAVHDMGGPETDVRSLLEADRQAAEAWGTASATGSADLAAGVLLDAMGDPAASELLASAERSLRTTGLRLRHAEALVALGVNRGDTDLFTEARRIAVTLGGLPLRDRIDRELRTASSPAGRQQVAPRPRAAADSLVLAKLSAAEGRVVELAVAGMSNPEIADALSVTRRTVELHLSRAYRKLGVSSRGELPGLVPAGVRG